jgi:hypothetical protein
MLTYAEEVEQAESMGKGKRQRRMLTYAGVC